MDFSEDVCEILFKFRAYTNLGQHVRIIGDHPSLGAWNPEKALILTTNPEIYPFWIASESVKLGKDMKIAFKCAIMQGLEPVQWEDRLSENREYVSTQKQVILKGIFNEPGLIELIEETFDVPAKQTSNQGSKLQVNTSKFSVTSSIASKTVSLNESDITSVQDTLSTNLLCSRFPKTKHQEEPKNNTHNEVSSKHKRQKSGDALQQENAEIFENSDEDEEEEVIQEELNDFAKIKNIVNISHKSYIDQYKQPTSEVCSKEGSPALHPGHFSSSGGNLVAESSIFDKDSIFQSYFKQMKESNQLKSIYTKLNSSNDIMYELNQDMILHVDDNVPIILATLFLPVSIEISAQGNYSICLMQSNFNSLLYKTLATDPARRKNFKWAGFLPYDPENGQFTAEKREKMLAELEEKHGLLVILIERELIFSFVRNFYHKYFENIISNIVEEDYTQVFNFSEDNWIFFKEVNKLLANRVLQALDDNTLVYIIDYRVFLTVGMLSYTSSKTSIGLFWDHSFPTLENFKYLPFKHEMLLSILCANVICFLDFRYARSFFSVAKSFLGLDYETNRGVLFILYLGRQIIIKIASQTPDFSSILKLKKTETFDLEVQKWKQRLPDCEIVISINSLDILNLTILKFELIHDFVAAKRAKRKIRFVQVIQKESWDEQIEYLNNLSSISEIYKLINDMNAIFGEEVFVVIDDPLSTESYLALMSISRVFLRAQIKPKNLFKCLEFLLATPDFSVVMISEFACYSKLCKSFVTFNLFQKTDFIDKLDSILTEENRETLRCNTMIDHEYFRENSCYTWLEQCLLDLLQTSNMIKYAQISSISMGAQYLKVLTNKRFRHLDAKLTLNNYIKKNQNRLIIFDVDGTLLPQDKYSHFQSKRNRSSRLFQAPEQHVLDNMKLLAQDPSNTVFLITGKGLEEFWSYFKLPQIGLACEYGYLVKDCNEKNWIRLCQLDLQWKEKAKTIISRFVENTELSLMIEKESAIVWKYGDVDKEMGAKQSEQLNKELREAFEGNNEIDIVVSKEYLEVRPFGMNKGTFTEILIKKVYEERGKIDFILIVGNGLSDEEMFVAAKKNLKFNPERFAPKTAPYLCVVGKRPSNAFYYVRDHIEVTMLIESFLDASTLACSI